MTRANISARFSMSIEIVWSYTHSRKIIRVKIICSRYALRGFYFPSAWRHNERKREMGNRLSVSRTLAPRISYCLYNLRSKDISAQYGLTHNEHLQCKCKPIEHFSMITYGYYLTLKYIFEDICPRVRWPLLLCSWRRSARCGRHYITRGRRADCIRCYHVTQGSCRLRTCYLPYARRSRQVTS